jgi:predicted nucleic acid-binding protein
MGDLTLSQAEILVADAVGGDVYLLPHEILAELALAMAGELRHPVYDCFDIACAATENARFVTADKRLLRAVGGTPEASYGVDLVGF